MEWAEKWQDEGKRSKILKKHKMQATDEEKTYMCIQAEDPFILQRASLPFIHSPCNFATFIVSE